MSEGLPQEWISVEEGIRHIMAVLQCSRDEAEAFYLKFKEERPESVKMVQLH